MELESATKDWGEERGICPYCQIEPVPLDGAGMPVYCLRCDQHFQDKHREKGGTDGK